jgi:glycine/D-amino acid oxidase-like deaminating enzyme
MVLSGLKPSMQNVLRKYGRAAARRLFQWSLDSIATVEQIVREERIDCGFARHGHLLVANKPSHYRQLAGEAEFMQREFGHRVRLVPPADLESEIGSRAYHGGMVDEVSGGLNPGQYVAGLARAAEQAGAALCARARVTRLGRDESGFVVETERGRVHASDVLAATSGYTGPATPRLQRKIVPVGSFLIATEALPPGQAERLIPGNRMVFDYRHYLNYFRMWGTRLIFGGRAAFFPESGSTVRESAEILRREMLHVFPQLQEARVEYAWGGTLDFAFDMMTHVGRADGVYFSLGYAGHGVAMATHLGQSLAAAILQGGFRNHPFAEIDFPGAPLQLYDGRPWFLPLAGLWYRFLDLIE